MSKKASLVFCHPPARSEFQEAHAQSCIHGAGTCHQGSVRPIWLMRFAKTVIHILIIHSPLLACILYIAFKARIDMQFFCTHTYVYYQTNILYESIYMMYKSTWNHMTHYHVCVCACQFLKLKKIHCSLPAALTQMGSCRAAE